MSRSDKDIECVLIAKHLANIDLSAEAIKEAAGGRLTESRVQRITERVEKTASKLSERFVANLNKRNIPLNE